ncbi:hypothetical protein EYF80_017847 [Liparis tanakae]|uniref:Uncharacterized protein n=1 Tax=Liparis tanakae TaxID=230148 RepID=A0A4Z2I1U7_9TELE|nr:hypothetical protein EYF80_017847 [Liparis tanakae]
MKSCGTRRTIKTPAGDERRERRPGGGAEAGRRFIRVRRRFNLRHAALAGVTPTTPPRPLRPGRKESLITAVGEGTLLLAARVTTPPPRVGRSGSASGGSARKRGNYPEFKAATLRRGKELQSPPGGATRSASPPGGATRSASPPGGATRSASPPESGPGGGVKFFTMIHKRSSAAARMKFSSLVIRRLIICRPCGAEREETASVFILRDRLRLHPERPPPSSS